MATPQAPQQDYFKDMTRLEAVHVWMEHFATCVRTRDLSYGKKLFAKNASGFGTRVRQAHSLAELVERQWDPTWNNTRDFRFAPQSVSLLPSRDGSQVVVTALWKSLGVNTEGNTFPRQGRCTIILHKCDSHPHGFAATHTHFSKDPAGDL